jgi:hypothetical protein
VAGVLLVVATAGLLMFGAVVGRQPAKVPELTIVNPSRWAVHVKVASAEAPGWLLVGSVPRESSSTFRETTDQGERWIVAFAYDGVSVEVPVDRADLEAADWTLTVPDELADELVDAGVFETPPGVA